MSKTVDFIFCELPETPREFNIEKFKEHDPKQIDLYNRSKTPYRKKLLKYEDLKIGEIGGSNYAREVPDDCVFIDFDNTKQATEMLAIILRSGLRCLVLETVKGYHFLFRKPDFYKVELTKAVNWFGYQFDCKGQMKGKKNPVQIMRVCGMERDEFASWKTDELIAPKAIDIDNLDILPYWLWGKKEIKDLHKGGKTGDRTKEDAVEYTLEDNPFTQLMKMDEGGRHNHIVERCSYFALSNGFELDEFKSLIQAIHDQYLVKVGPSMSDSDLFGDLPKRWDDYTAMLESEGWDYDETERRWKKIKDDKKIDERRAAEYLYSQFDFYATGAGEDGLFKKILYKEIDGPFEYKTDLTVIRQALKDYKKTQNFKESFFKEVEVQLMQMCAANNKRIRHSNTYVLSKNKVMSCISDDAYDFAWLDSRSPTDVVLPWNWYSKEWVEEHKDDLGGIITKFIKDLSRNSKGIHQPEVEQWLWVTAGACMIPKNDLEQIVILSGGGNNGKTVFNSLIRFCLGDDMYNTSKIFDCDPQDRFWGKDFDKGICCIVDDLPPHYSKATFSYLKGALTNSDSVEINEKFKPKRLLGEIPQILICNNHDLKLNDKSDGMKRRVKILPTECYIEEDEKDIDLQYKLVLNTTNSTEVYEYKMSEEASHKAGTPVMKLYTREKCVLDSLKNGSLAWFANKARYEYFKAKEKKFLIGNTDEMKKLTGDTFKNIFEIECEKFIKWYVNSECGTDSDRDLSKANNHFKNLYPIYESYCETEGIEKMKIGQFNKYCSKAITNLGYQITDKRDEQGQPYRYIIFGEEVSSSKK